ncbi:MAG: energy-coupling factor ABC transporter ATP-binding protein [Dehalococcoidales bacterium]|nr:energy-coupling factor ABC transporter ATP-binding protein [Dehalococcoidales bacterium]
MDEIIRLSNLTYTYPDGRQALKDINLVIHQGGSVAIIGPNGAGKSTLLLHLNGIIQSDGQVSVQGKPVTEANLKEVRRRIGLVFQNPDDQLFSATVFDDVAFGPLNLGFTPEQVKAAVTDALEKVGLTGFEERSPHHLSFGERKRVAIATVLSMNPEVIVMDEPTSNLDPRGKWRLIELLKAVPVTRIIATHDLELVDALCTRIIVLDGGRIVADDAADVILKNEHLLKAHGLARPDGVTGGSASGIQAQD